MENKIERKHRVRDVLHGFRIRFFRTKSAKVGWILILSVLILVLLGPLFVPYSPTATTGAADSPPSLAHPFGPDYLGHDLLSQVIYGAYLSLLVGLIAALGATLFGFVVSVLGGYYSKL